jgi:hypothetical protein
MLVSVCRAQERNSWSKPAAELAEKIAGILGPGPVAFNMRNLSSIHAEQIPEIRKSLEDALRSHGVTAGSADSANSVRVTLSENSREQLWVAEMIEGNKTRVAMVELGPAEAEAVKSSAGMSLRRQELISMDEQVLAALEIPAGVLVLEPEQVVLFAKAGNIWKEQQHARLNISHPTGRDPRGALLVSANGVSFDAWLPGSHCSGSIASTPERVALNTRCSDSDDPWALTQPPLPLVAPASLSDSANVTVEPIRAFYNAARNAFTGVLVPGAPADLPPFFSLAMIPRINGMGILVDAIDGKVQLAENGALRTLAGTRDWGSDLATLNSGCGVGAQVVVSGSGDAPHDSLRAYEVPALEALPVSESLELEGSVMTLSTASDGKSLLAIVRHTGDRYEVDRVTALCN